MMKFTTLRRMGLTILAVALCLITGWAYADYAAVRKPPLAELCEFALPVFQEEGTGRFYAVNGIAQKFKKPAPGDYTGMFMILNGQPGQGTVSFQGGNSDCIATAMYDGNTRLVIVAEGWVLRKPASGGAWAIDTEANGQRKVHTLTITVEPSGLLITGSVFGNTKRLRLTTIKVNPRERPFTFLRGLDGKPVAMQVGGTNN